MREQQDCTPNLAHAGSGNQLPHRWEKVLDGGAGRGLNQGAASMTGFRDALYVGTGIQNGGYDWRNKIGPAAAEIIRVNADGSWDIIVGNARDGKEPLVDSMQASIIIFQATYGGWQATRAGSMRAPWIGARF
jgi:hypothetical protein